MERMNQPAAAAADPPLRGSALEVFVAALRLGCTSFGGPIAHLGYFERSYVRQRRWLSEEAFAGLVALCQALPGPASSQVGFLIGLHRAGWAGALASWLGFTLPSALLMLAGALLIERASGPAIMPLVHGLKLAAVAVVAQAVWNMARRLCPDWRRRLIAVAAAAAIIGCGDPAVQLPALVAGALAGLWLCRSVQDLAPPPDLPVRRRHALFAAALFAALLALTALAHGHDAAELAALLYRSGALIFGGGHVMLPVLHEALVPAGWISHERFLAGYGLAQAMPGPLFAFSAYVGAAIAPPAFSAAWAALAVASFFLPGLLLSIAAAGLWNRLSHWPHLLAALAGINAAVVGVLAAALYDPVSTTAILNARDAFVAIVGLLLLERWRVPPLAVVALCTGSSLAFSLL